MSLRSLATTLEGRLGDSHLKELSRDPARAIRSLGIRIKASEVPRETDECGCDGMYVRGSPPTVIYVPTPRSRRENFTLAHELGHHLVRDNDDVNSELGDIGDDGGTEAEERLCDAFAGRVLIPDRVIDAVLGKRHPEASDVRALYAESAGSREACVVRLAERLPCFGYVALLDATTHEVRFASPSPDCEYRWPRGSRISSHHPVWKAWQSADGFRGEGPIEWGSSKKNVWIDAVRESSTVAAIFASERYWAATGLSLLGGTGPTKPRPTALSGTCRHCGANAWGYKACEKCGDPWCKRCKRCGCGAPDERPQKTCAHCKLTRATSQFETGSEICRDCA